MNVLERAKAHFDAQGVTRIEVPEWPDEKGNPTVMYSQPFTLADRKKLIKYAQEDDLEFIVRMVIMKCETQDGEKAFDLSDKPVLMNKVDPNIVARIAATDYAAPSKEDQLGN
jgi:hypothetical protein